MLHALWRTLGETTEEALSFRLGEYDLTIDLQAPDHPSPECAVLYFREGEVALGVF